MFTERQLAEPVAAVRDAREVLVLDCAEDFETLPPEQTEELGLVVDSLDPASYPEVWLPPDAPEVLRRYAGGELTVGMPGDGSVAWTRQTNPPVVLCKPRLAGPPEDFANFLIAEAVVQATLGEPEHFFPFFGDRYPDFAAAVAGHLGPVETYQLAVACYDAFLGLSTRDIFAGWEGGDTDPLFRTWLDAGDRLADRLDGLAGAAARGEIAFTDAAELACNGIKHAVERGPASPDSHARQDAPDIPAPFDALDAEAYLDGGADYACRWAERTVESLD